MNIVINQKPTSKNEILIFDQKEKGFKNMILKTYFNEELILKESQKYTLGLLPTIQPKDSYYTIVIKLQNFNIIHEIAEELVLAISAMIKKVGKERNLDLNSLKIDQDIKNTITELLGIQMYEFIEYKKPQTQYKLSIQNEEYNSKTFILLNDSINYARTLVNHPASTLHPESFEKEVKTKIKKIGCTLTTLTGEQLQKKGLNGIYEVGKGSQHKPRLLIISYKGNKTKQTDFALIGKGVCFDAGGYNIKPTGGMEEMKIDMAGAATVMGILSYLSQIKIKKNIIVGIPLVENLVSGNAFKPGDIIKMYNGKTVEIGNTDAEGRLILADTLSYVQEMFSPSYIFDFATLTGAQVIALGGEISAMYGDNTNLTHSLQKMSREIFDKVRELPLYKPYFKSYTSEIADCNNIGKNRQAGSIGAALFLQQFITNENRLHFDIAGPAYTSGRDMIGGPGATGTLIRLISKYIENSQ